MKILVITKQPTLDRYSPEQLARLEAIGLDQEDELERGRRCHQESSRRVFDRLEGHDYRTAMIDELDAAMVAGCDLVVTLGGDGTVLAANSLVHEIPVLAVNSDPERSLGHFTRCQSAAFGEVLEAFQTGATGVERVFRLQLEATDRAPVVFLNEVLIANRNPSLMSRYRLRVGDREEDQASSGLWVSTPAGSTGAIASAGMPPHPELDAALLFKVREPFQRRRPLDLLEGIQDPPVGLEVLATIPNMGCYIDGSYLNEFELRIGDRVRISPAGDPLLLVTPPA